jgi:hypothetical protein
VKFREGGGGRDLVFHILFEGGEDNQRRVGGNDGESSSQVQQVFFVLGLEEIRGRSQESEEGARFEEGGEI